MERSLDKKVPLCFYKDDMAVTIIGLGGIEKGDFSLLVGKTVLLKFTQEPSLLDGSSSLRRFINSKDLLLDTTKLGAVAELVALSGEVQKSLGHSIRRRDSIPLLDMEERKAMMDFYKRSLISLKEKVKENSKRIRQIENELKLYLGQQHELYFCRGCNAYLGPIDEMLPSVCQACKEPATPKTGEGNLSLRFLSEEMINYLNGIWVQDYLARVLRKPGWKTWTECRVMGSSGVDHQIDLLAVNEERGRVVIAECKTQAVSEHAFQLITQFADIQPSFGLLISRNPMNYCEGKSLIEKKPGLKLIELAGKSDDEVGEVLARYIDGDN